MLEESMEFVIEEAMLNPSNKKKGSPKRKHEYRIGDSQIKNPEGVRGEYHRNFFLNKRATEDSVPTSLVDTLEKGASTLGRKGAAAYLLYKRKKARQNYIDPDFAKMKSGKPFVTMKRAYHDTTNAAHETIKNLGGLSTSELLKTGGKTAYNKTGEFLNKTNIPKTNVPLGPALKFGAIGIPAALWWLSGEDAPEQEIEPETPVEEVQAEDSAIKTITGLEPKQAAMLGGGALAAGVGTSYLLNRLSKR